jgi:adenosylcobinamide kinase/adenosylcobinamide-phosphate guanylyltransferase
MRVFISGGCKNGKSSFAEAWSVFQAGADRPLYYLATMVPRDAEDQARIRQHRLMREGIPFQTIEEPLRIGQALSACDPGGQIMWTV